MVDKELSNQLSYGFNSSDQFYSSVPGATFIIKDSGKREEFASGMERDTAADKINYTRITVGPMFDRWAAHLTKGAKKYPDVKPGVANWTLAAGLPELARFEESALRHFMQWLRGNVDEDHAAAVFFNINGAEYVKGRLNEPAKNQISR